MDSHDRYHETYQARVDSVGRVLIPAPSRHRLGIHRGDTLIVEVDDQGIRMRTSAQALRDAQALFARIAVPGESIVDELLRGRREEAASE